VLHMLPAGAGFDLTTRTLVQQSAEVTAEDAAEIAEAEHDLRRMARDIAAADASPSALRRRLARSRRKRVHDEPAEPEDGITS
jgi:cyanophycinase